jgi:hypothetical protein
LIIEVCGAINPVEQKLWFVVANCGMISKADLEGRHHEISAGAALIPAAGWTEFDTDFAALEGDPKALFRLADLRGVVGKHFPPHRFSGGEDRRDGAAAEIGLVKAHPLDVVGRPRRAMEYVFSDA